MEELSNIKMPVLRSCEDESRLYVCAVGSGIRLLFDETADGGYEYAGWYRCGETVTAGA